MSWEETLRGFWLIADLDKWSWSPRNQTHLVTREKSNCQRVGVWVGCPGWVPRALPCLQESVHCCTLEPGHGTPQVPLEQVEQKETLDLEVGVECWPPAQCPLPTESACLRQEQIQCSPAPLSVLQTMGVCFELCLTSLVSLIADNFLRSQKIERSKF